ncbi:MAG: mannose-1-phosphate guanylyltransferase/mannose-6-phosphate isomerase [Nitrosomonadaceae bacterium]|nr:mannose-1-phosphate guanylyltransferase/mannose-6-phosphate isomerase [Nitrosomonadaceae bacterium]|tara:strand:- start:379 stop:1821 length:1443 start_codon:yes stop_codon:yes gene_type:complete
MHSLTPVILCGGSGTRLWPLSREQYPKQLLQLLDGNNSLLQSTIQRIEGFADTKTERTIVVCNEEYRFVVAEQLRVINKNATIILEPEGRNTAPALTISALYATQNNNDPVLLVMPADHIILDVPSFQDTIQKSMKLALDGAIVTFGITPESPETGYGYIKYGPKYDKDGALYIECFVEKPDSKTAEFYLGTNSYLWNSGLFMVRASVWISAISQYRADILKTCQKAWAQHSINGEFLRPEKKIFLQCPSESIDYAIMENIGTKMQSFPIGLVKPLSAGWSDIGTWESLWKILPKNNEGNVSQGDVLLHNCKNTLSISTNRLVTCIGTKNLVVVETPDAILIADKNKTQDVKEIVDKINKKKRTEGQVHRKVLRPWGWYDCIDIGKHFQVKRITVNPGASLSLQMHHHRAEHWIVVRGSAQVTCGDSKYLVSINESTFIPLGTKHRLQNPGPGLLEMIEVQSGSYLGEDDIVRFEDIYGR